MEYKVIWEIDIEADSPREAAQIARNYQLDPDSTATFFNVSDDNNAVLIDLMDNDHDQS